MSHVTLGIILGIVIGLVSVGIMLPMHFAERRAALTAAFMNRFALGFLVANVHLPIDQVFTGVVVGLLVSIPDAIVTRAYVPVLVGGIVFGIIGGWTVKLLGG